MSYPGPGAQPIFLIVDGTPVSGSNPLPTTGGGGGGGTVDQGAANGDAAKGWSARLTDGAAFIVPAKTGQFPAALGATTAAGSVSVGIATDQLSTLATAAKQDTGNASLASIDTKLTAPLSVTVTGTAASGAAVSGNPVLVAGSNAGTARTISVDASGQQVVVGPGTAGSASGGVLSVQGVASMTPVQVSQATASSLNATVVGGAANAAAVSGNPVLVAGYDGTNTRTLSTDTSGRQRNAGATVFAYITAADTTTVKSSAGILRAVHITAAFSAGSLTVYNANGTASNPIAGFGSGVTQSFLFNLECSNGITVVTGASFNGQVTVVVD